MTNFKEGIEMKETKRIKILREQMLELTPEICAERDLLITESYKETEGLAMVIRRAKALQNVLNNMPIKIFDQELIVGNLSSKARRGSNLYPEMSVDWKKDELDRFEKRDHDKFYISESTKKIYREEIFPYWKGKTIDHKVFSLLPQETKRLVENNQIFYLGLHIYNGLGHVILDYEKVLKDGFYGIRKKTEERLGLLNLAKIKDLESSYLLRAVIIVCDAVIAFAKRYSKKAKEMSKKEKNLTRKQELEKIAEICQRIPAYPAKTFHEAVQSFFFVQLICHIESDGTAISPGRFDQYMYPYYKESINSGKIDQEGAQEIIDCLWIKFNEILKVWSEEDVKVHAGFPVSQNLTLGGQTSEGKDATNELSYMCLQSIKNTRLPQPATSVRLHNSTPKLFLLETCAVIKIGTGMPALYNDEIIIPALLGKSVSLEDARDYALVGCMEPSIPGKDWMRSFDGYFNFAKALNLTLNDGKCMLTGDQLGLKTGKFTDFETFEDFMEAFKKQVNYFVHHMIITNNIIEMAHAELVPLPFISSLVDDCIEKGKDVTKGGAKYNATGGEGVGTGTIADSFAVIKKFVFEEEAITKEKLMEVLRDDYEGNETIRALFTNKAPKYGNDDEYVDNLAREATNIFARAYDACYNSVGAKYFPALLPVASNVALGFVTAATPDGRKAHEPLSEGISPVQGRDRTSPTALVKSAARIDQILFKTGVLLNMKFTPSSLEGEGLEKFANLIKVYFKLKGQHVQFNVVSAETLKDAQRNPDEYKDLIVRVAGYSAFFNDLDRKVQNDIIARTELKL